MRGEVSLPGSKSLTNRALLLAALCDGPVTLTRALFSEDTNVMTNALRQLGFEAAVDPPATTMRLAGRGGRIPAPSADIFVGNAGTAARFLTALCAAAPQGAYRLDGVPRMRTRPMKGLIDALRVLGADIHCPGAEGFFPIEIHARGLRGGSLSMDASESSQLLSALDQTVVGTAMPRVIADLNGLSHYAWVATGYLLASAASMPIWGKLSDAFGRRRFFIVGMVIFVVGSGISSLPRKGLAGQGYS